MTKNIAILIPCYNEEITIGKVIQDFKKELPEAKIYVYDNNSTDNTSAIAQENGAIVYKEKRQGKGNVVQSMFRDIKADIYVMVDGDDTYPSKEVHKLIAPIENNTADMSIGDRHSNGSYEKENKRHFHGFGNALVKNIINKLFKEDLKDIMSGYRAFSEEFVKMIPILSNGFEVETELTIQALDKKFRIVEVPISYQDRPEGSYSKLNTYLDGIRVLHIILMLMKDYRPLQFFTIVFMFLFLLSLSIGLPVIIEFINTSFITKIPSAILSVGIMIISILFLLIGIILDTSARNQKENFQILRKTLSKR